MKLQFTGVGSCTDLVVGVVTTSLPKRRRDIIPICGLDPRSELKLLDTIRESLWIRSRKANYYAVFSFQYVDLAPS